MTCKKEKSGIRLRRIVGIIGIITAVILFSTAGTVSAATYWYSRTTYRSEIFFSYQWYSRCTVDTTYHTITLTMTYPRDMSDIWTASVYHFSFGLYTVSDSRGWSWTSWWPDVAGATWTTWNYYPNTYTQISVYIQWWYFGFDILGDPAVIVMDHAYSFWING